jgi:hypothetical protein
MEEIYSNSNFCMLHTITLVKCDGIRVENIQAFVDENEITIFDMHLQIEPQDTIERWLPNGLPEIYKVLNVVYDSGFPFPPNQRRARQVIKVSKANVSRDELQPTTVDHNYGSVQHGSHNVAYNNQGSAAQELADLIAQMRTSVHALDLPEEEKEEAQQMIAVLEEQTKAQPSNVSRIKALAKSTFLYLADKGIDLSVSLGGTVLGSILLKSLHLT